jgi:hypothetical protein
MRKETTMKSALRRVADVFRAWKMWSKGFQAGRLFERKEQANAVPNPQTPIPQTRDTDGIPPVTISPMQAAVNRAVLACGTSPRPGEYGRLVDQFMREAMTRQPQPPARTIRPVMRPEQDPALRTVADEPTREQLMRNPLIRAVDRALQPQPEESWLNQPLPEVAPDAPWLNSAPVAKQNTDPHAWDVIEVMASRSGLLPALELLGHETPTTETPAVYKQRQEEKAVERRARYQSPEIEQKQESEE